MKKLNNKIDMFCYRHPRFGVPNLMLYIVVISLAVWLLSIMDSSRTLMSYRAYIKRTGMAPYHVYVHSAGYEHVGAAVFLFLLLDRQHARTRVGHGAI